LYVIGNVVNSKITLCNEVELI